MPRRRALILALFALAACQPDKDETISAFAGADRVWRLVELDGEDFPARATIRFPTPGHIEGQAPCNAYSGEQTAPYPWVEIGAITATKRACPALAFETAFFQALAQAAFGEVSGDILLLSDEAGREMVFRADPP